MDILTLFFIFIAIELFESNWQKSQTLHGYLANNYTIYRKNFFLFLLLNSSFIYSLFLIFYLNNATFLMISIVGMKFLDIAFKLNILTKMDKGINLDEVMPNIQMGLVLRYLNVLIYPISFIIASNYLIP